MMTQLNCSEAVSAARNGDEEAWNLLYHSYYPFLYNLALRVFGNTPQAADAVQETFITAYLKLNQLSRNESFPAWLKKILLRYCYRLVKNNKSRNAKATLLPGADYLWEDEIRNTEEHLANTSQLYHALLHVPDAFRITLLLRCFSSFNSYEDIATILSIPVGTVRSRLHIAKTRLTEFWNAHHNAGMAAFREAEEWNHFYLQNFTHVHNCRENRQQFLSHLDKDLKVVFTTGNTCFGRTTIEKEIEGDIRCGSHFGDVRVITSNNLSIVEVKNYNSPEYPTRCPASSIFILYRDARKIKRMDFHHSI